MSLDRILENSICAKLSELIPTIQVAPDLNGQGDDLAVVPRCVVKCESQDTPDLHTVGVKMVDVEIRAIVRASDQECQGQLAAMAAAIEAAFGDAQAFATFDTSELQIYGLVTGGQSQEREDDRLITVQRAMIPARLR